MNLPDPMSPDAFALPDAELYRADAEGFARAAEPLVPAEPGMEAPPLPPGPAGRPRRWELGLGLAMIVILLGGIGLAVRSISRDWRGLTQELSGLLPCGSPVAAMPPVQRPNRPSPALPAPAAEPRPAPVAKAPAVAPAEEPALAESAVAPQGETEIAGPDRSLARDDPSDSPEAAASPADPTRSAEEEIRAHAEKRQQELAELDKLKEEEAKDLANQPRRRRPSVPRGFVIPPDADIDALMKEQLAAAEEMMRQMIGNQRQGMADPFEMMRRLQRELDQAAGAGAPDWPPRNLPRLDGAPGLDLPPGLADESIEQAFRMLQQLENQMRERAGAGPGAPRMRRFERRLPNGGVVRGFEIRAGG